MNTFKRIFLIAASGVLVFGQGCQNSPLVDAFVDSDNDGWYDRNRNQRIQLFIERIENNTGSSFNNRPAIAIDDRIIVQSGTLFSGSEAVASRSIGAWGMPERTDTFSAELRIAPDNIHTAQRHRFTFSNTDSAFSVSHNDYEVHFRMERTLFSDPSPQDPDGDSDADGLTDTEEARINSPRRSVGHPREKDILLIVGYTHPDWNITRLSKDLLTTVFFNRRRINLCILTENDPVLNVDPGQVEINAEVPNRDHSLSFAELGEIRPQLISGQNGNLFHVVVLAETLNDGAWGRGDAGRPARNLICRSHLPFLGPDVLQYQAKTIMHELGHNLGLCHPSESNGDCPTGAIPASERNGGLSAMGTPAEAAGPVEVMVEALTRPLDYTPGQWQNARLDRLKAE